MTRAETRTKTCFGLNVLVWGESECSQLLFAMFSILFIVHFYNGLILVIMVIDSKQLLSAMFTSNAIYALN